MFSITDGELKISVRAFVEFLCRGGDIDNRFGGVGELNAMQAGSRAHRRIQKAMGPEYMAEVPLGINVEGDNYNIRIEGRADGLYADDDVWYIDEIKGTYRDIRYITEPVYVHKAQAMCYAYFCACINGYERMGIRMTYVNLDNDNIKYFEEIVTRETLREWFDGLIGELRKWGDYINKHHEQRNASIRGLQFPFEYRDGQKELVVNVYKAINRERNLFIQAPTGVGKTISTVYPSVMAVGEEKADKIFYLTAKTITRTVAEETFNILRERGLDFKTITITAKDKICFHEGELGPECNPVACPYAKGHFDRVNEAVYDLITNEEVISRQVLEKYAVRHQVCPFEFCLDVSYWVDGIICDYNYVFDPHVYLKRFFADNSEGEYIFLIDEAHNLVDRAREMYSAVVYKEEFLTIKKLVQNADKKLAGALERCNRDMLAMKRQCESDYAVLESDDMFSLNMQRLGEEMIRFMEKHRDFVYMKELREFFFEVSHYNEMHESLDENYIIYNEHMDNGFMIRLFCVNPSVNLKKRLQKGRNAVFFSATLLPVNYYKELLTGDVEEYAIYADSPFDINKRLLLVGRDVSSRYTRRNITEYTKIKNYIDSITGAKQGNYLVFFPSYQYMYDVYKCMEQDLNRKIIMQQKDMSEEARESFLQEFDDGQNESTLIGFCVMGGIFSEGIDLKNESLIGGIIVGTGLPSINTASQLLRMYFDDRNNCGYEYAYVYPGMNKVLQAAGRVIRTEADTGVIALLDDRFLTAQYMSLFPKEWNNYRRVIYSNVQEEILDFWGNMIYNVVESV